MRDRFTPGDPPIKTMIKKHLAMPINDFSKRTGIGQSTISMWIKREVQAQNLPMYFISSLSDVSNQTSDQVYHTLLRLQAEYEISKRAATTVLLTDSIQLFESSKQEAQAILEEAKGNNTASQMILPAGRKLTAAYEKKRHDRFMETLIPLYSELNRTLPAWITLIYAEDDQFNAIAQGYSQYFSKLT